MNEKDTALTEEQVIALRYKAQNPSRQFINDCLRTKSDKFYGELVNKDVFKTNLQTLIHGLNYLDRIKKAFFYARENLTILGDSNCRSIDDLLDVDIIHCILGKATEAGELLELLYDVLYNGKEFDKINFKEELFDGNWYDGIGLNAVNSTFEEIWERGIAKLKVRFKEKFTEQAANNRNLDAERKTLEN